MVSASTIGDAARRLLRDRFVGRGDEIDLFERMLADDRSQILWLFGPGGIGKSTLLQRFADRARQSGDRPHAVDPRTADPSSELVLTDTAAAGSGRNIVFVDALERLTHGEEWLRATALPQVPDGTLVVIASRSPPSVAWRTDDVTGPLTVARAVRGLSLDEGTELLVRCAVPADRARHGARIARGHPLALAMLSEALATGAELERIDDAPDLVALLLSHIVGEVPDTARRRALEACAIARVTTRSMLRSVVPDAEAGELYEWLATRPYVDRLPDGLCPHDLVRDLLEVDLRLTDPDRYRERKLAVRRYILDRQRELGMVDRLAADLVYLHRSSSLLSSFWSWSSFGAGRERDLTPDDESDVEALFAAHNPSEVVTILRHWMRRQPEAFRLVREAGELVGVFAILHVDEPREDDLAADPVLAAVWHSARTSGRIQPGEAIGVARFFDDRIEGQSVPSRTFNALTVASTRQWMLDGQVADYIACIRDVDAWMPMFDYLDFHRVAEADTDVGGQVFHVVWRDWRHGGRLEWLDMMEARELGAAVAPGSRETPVIVALRADDFADAVRMALRDLHRPERLARSPLLASRLVRDRTDGDPVARLVVVFRDALGCLPTGARTDKARRALDRTYFHGAVSQEAAAEVLGMAFSTYRRHLKAGVELLVDQLWRWEIYGRDESSEGDSE